MIAITGRAARLSCFFVRRQLAAASLLADELLKFILAASDCPPMVDSFLTPVMRRQCSFFNGLCYMILRILSYGAFSLTWLTGYVNLLEQIKEAGGFPIKSSFNILFVFETVFRSSTLFIRVHLLLIHTPSYNSNFQINI